MSDIVDVVPRRHRDKLETFPWQLASIVQTSLSEVQPDTSSPNGYLALSPIFMISRKRRSNVLTTLQQNACLLVLSVSGSFVNKNSIKHVTKFQHCYVSRA